MADREAEGSAEERLREFTAVLQDYCREAFGDRSVEEAAQKTRALRNRSEVVALAGSARLREALAGERTLEGHDLLLLFELAEAFGLFYDTRASTGAIESRARAQELFRRLYELVEPAEAGARSIAISANVGFDKYGGRPVATGSIASLIGDAGAGAAVAAGFKYAADVAMTMVTQRGETKREELRQGGETERARIAKDTAPAAAAPDVPPPGAAEA